MATVVVFAGEYDLSVKQELRSELDRLVCDGKVVLDFSDVQFLDSTCLAELIRLENTRRQSGREPLTIVLPPGNPVGRLFDVAGMRSVFNVVESLEIFEGIAIHDGRPLESDFSEIEQAKPV